MSAAETLEKVAYACAAIADDLMDANSSSSNQLVIITHPGGEAGFRFRQTLTINGQQIEVQVRTVK